MLKSNNTFLSILKNALIFTLVYAIITAIFTLFATFILNNTNDPLAYIGLTAKVVSLVSTFIAAFALAKRIKEKYLLSGIILGTLIVCILVLLYFIVGENDNFNPTIYLLTIISSTIGCFFGRKREKRKKTRHKRK